MTIEVIEFPKTHRGNDPADHPDDEGYHQEFKERVNEAGKERDWRRQIVKFRVTDAQVADIEDRKSVV